MNFEELNLNASLLSALEELEYIHPTPIQEKAFPVIMSGQDVIGLAQTGTGKTFAYLLPILRQHKFTKSKHPKTLILVPTRELVMQVVQEIEKLSKYITLRYTGIYGGSNINPQKQAVFNGLDILVATPGRLIDLAAIGSLNLKQAQHLVIDEVDEMMDQGFRSQLTTIMDLMPPKRQNILFSATLSPDIETIISTFFTNPKKIEIAAHGTPLDKIIQGVYHVPNYHTKVSLLLHLLKTDENMSKIMVFVASKKLADSLFEQVNAVYPDHVALIHSGKTQSNRFTTLSQFQEGKFRVLIATDIAARGLDIKDVTHVINFDTPAAPGDYLHRIGRTGRAGKAGIAITFANEPEEANIKAIEVLMKREIEITILPDAVEVSSIFTEDELPAVLVKNYFKNQKRKSTQSVVHEKKAKNKKEHLGGPRKRKPHKTKPRNRGVERNRARKK